MKVIDCIQGSPEWFEHHRGVPTASNFSRIITPKTMQLSASAGPFIAELIAQKLGGKSMMPEKYVSRPMLDGIAMEPEARNWYSMDRDVDVKQVGMCVTDDGRFGASPDALVGDNGCLELKCPLPHTHVSYLLAGVLPAEYAAQVHGELIVTGREWVDFVSYVPGLPVFVVRQYPNHFTKALGAVLDRFWDRYQDALARVVMMGTVLEIRSVEPVEPVVTSAKALQDAIAELEGELPDFLRSKE